MSQLVETTKSGEGSASELDFASGAGRIWIATLLVYSLGNRFDHKTCLQETENSVPITPVFATVTF